MFHVQLWFFAVQFSTGPPSFFLFLILCFLLKFRWIPSCLFWILSCYSASFAVESVSRGISLVYLWTCNVSLLWEFDWAVGFVGHIWLITLVGICQYFAIHFCFWTLYELFESMFFGVAISFLFCIHSALEVLLSFILYWLLY